MYSVLNTLSEYTYFYIPKDITSYTFLLVFKIVESPQSILNFLERIAMGMDTSKKLIINGNVLSQLFGYPLL